MGMLTMDQLDELVRRLNAIDAEMDLLTRRASQGQQFVVVKTLSEERTSIRRQLVADLFL